MRVVVDQRLTDCTGHEHLISSAALEWRDGAAQQDCPQRHCEHHSAQRSGTRAVVVRAVLTRGQIVTHLQGVNLYSRFKSMLNKLSLLWELVLTGESLLVVSPSPEISSDAVYGLVSLISPVRY